MNDPIDSRYIQHSRQQNQRFVCPLCSSHGFQKEDVLWSHVTSTHSDASPPLEAEEAEVESFRSEIVKQAVAKAVPLSPAIHGHNVKSGGRSMQRGSSNDSMRPNVDNASRPQTPGSPGAPDVAAVKLDQLSLEQSQELARGRTSRNPPSPPPKRHASTEKPVDSNPEGGSREPGSLARNTSSATPGGIRTHKRPKSDPDLSRKGPHVKASDSRPRSRVKQRLYEPGRDPQNASGRPQSSGSPVILTRGDQHYNAKAEDNSQGPGREKGVLPIAPPAENRYPDMILQPDSRPISHDQLAAEVKGIYAGLVMVEAKCINIDSTQATASQSSDGKQAKSGNEQWQALIALHRTLSYEHHDFLLASQHPSASPALKRLASKYSMPARMWKHAIHSFSEVLRHRLPESIDYMLHFIYLAYQMMALLYETVPMFEDTWIECLGDLGRYRMAIEDDDMRDREVWGGVARFWYSKASDKNPSVGRLYHHLGILARPNALQQLYFYTRSLTSVQPFYNARESIMTLFDPLLGRSQLNFPYIQPVDSVFVKMHALMFEGQFGQETEASLHEHLAQADAQIGRITAKWKEQGAFIAVANISAWYEYGSQENILRKAYDQAANPKKPTDDQTQPGQTEDDTKPDANPDTKIGTSVDIRPVQESAPELLPQSVQYASQVTFSIFAVALRRIGDRNVLPHIHILSVFIRSLATLNSSLQSVIYTLLRGAPWAELSNFSNTLSRLEPINERIEDAGLHGHFIRSEKGDSKPLPEDYLFRGTVWCQSYFEDGWFNTQEDEEGRSLELASTNKMRAERVLWLGICLAMSTDYLHYDKNNKVFFAPSAGTTEVTSQSTGISQDPEKAALKMEHHTPPVKTEPFSTEVGVKIEGEADFARLPHQTEMVE